jgi:hypothetical protein
MSYAHAVGHGKKYNQNAVIYSGPETGGKVHLVHLKDAPDFGKKAGEHTDLGEFHPRKTGEFYSRIRNHQFASGRGDDKPDNTQPKTGRQGQVSDRDVFKFEAYDGPILGWKYFGGNIGEAEMMSLEIRRRLNEQEQK